jgi:hypothetical protein
VHFTVPKALSLPGIRTVDGPTRRYGGDPPDDIRPVKNSFVEFLWLGIRRRLLKRAPLEDPQKIILDLVLLFSPFFLH